MTECQFARSSAGQLTATDVGGVLFWSREGVGRFLMLALLGWLFGWIFVLFFPVSPGLNQAMNFTGILLFAALTVGTQTVSSSSHMTWKASRGWEGWWSSEQLALYLDFINLFLLLLRTLRR